MNLLDTERDPNGPVYLGGEPREGEFARANVPVINGATTRTNQTGLTNPSDVRSSQRVTLTIKPGLTDRVVVAGTTFRIIFSTGPVEVQPRPNFNRTMMFMGEGQTVADPGFDKLELINPSATANLTVTIWVGHNWIEDHSPALYPVTATEGLTVIASAAIQPLSTTDLYFRQGFLWGYKSFTNGLPTNNAGNVAIGMSAAFQPTLIFPGGGYTLYQAPQGQLYNLANFFMQGANPDGIFWSLT